MERKWWVLLAVGAASFMTALDGSVANIILPVLSGAFKANVAMIEWVVTIYLLVVSGLLLSFGRLGDMRGHKTIYLVGFGIFMAGSFFSGSAPSAAILIASRLSRTALVANTASVVFWPEGANRSSPLLIRSALWASLRPS